MIFEGAISVKAAIMAKRRIVEKVIVDKNKRDRNISYIINQALASNIPVEYVERNAIDELCMSTNHGGIIAFVDKRESDLFDTIAKARLICLLEGIEDPFNFGYCLRSLLAAGFEGVIVGERNWLSSADVVTKSSAGASEYLAIYTSKDIAQDLFVLKKTHTILCADRKDATSIYQINYDQPLVLAIGGEKRGLSKAVLSIADTNIYIPYANEFRNALNASSAVSVIAFEIMRQLQK